jgi:desulfoferrodoxin (superoxide reductase-like protein)
LQILNFFINKQDGGKNMIKKYGLIISAVFILSLLAVPLFANKTSVTIDAPDNALRGGVITIKITATHDGNSFFHYTNWVYIKVNGKEIARWDFSSSKRPENGVFTKEATYVIFNGPVVIEAEGNCNIHGSAGIATKEVKIK